MTTSPGPRERRTARPATTGLKAAPSWSHIVFVKKLTQNHHYQYEPPWSLSFCCDCQHQNHHHRAGGHKRLILVLDLYIYILYGSAGVSGNSRSRPFPGIPDTRLGMDFSFPFLFPKVGSTISHCHSIPKSWECNSSVSKSLRFGLNFLIHIKTLGFGLEKNWYQKKFW